MKANRELILTSYAIKAINELNCHIREGSPIEVVGVGVCYKAITLFQRNGVPLRYCKLLSKRLGQVVDKCEMYISTDNGAVIV
tara:strand:- start:3990 stop:4238 length:249 start_codon:yes stop_codon:yes gene_type:complete